MPSKPKFKPRPYVADPPTELLKALVERDQKLYPLTQVLDVEVQAIRLINLPPMYAVLFCYATDLGEYEQDRMIQFKNRVFYVEGVWTCGKYKALDQPNS